jgi:hypothetical protein
MAQRGDEIDLRSRKYARLLPNEYKLRRDDVMKFGKVIRTHSLMAPMWEIVATERRYS